MYVHEIPNLPFPPSQERRRQEITQKVEQIQEIEKEEAVQARKELFEQRKQQKSKIAHLAGQVTTVSMVCALITSGIQFYLPSLPYLSLVRRVE